jgi:hypothetical protein
MRRPNPLTYEPIPSSDPQDERKDLGSDGREGTDDLSSALCVSEQSDILSKSYMPLGSRRIAQLHTCLG